MMGEVIKSYTLTPEQEAEVEDFLAKGEEKYKDIAHIVCETDVDMGPFFEHELEEK